MTRTATIACRSEAATGRVAASLASLAAPGQVLVLAGGLGAGKTTFVKAYAAALGVHVAVTSPSYALVHHYPCPPGAPVAVLVHADLWRLRDARELADLALDELVADGAAALVEWGDRFDGSLPGDPVVVSFDVTGERSRTLTVDLAGSALPDDALELVGGR